MRKVSNFLYFIIIILVVAINYISSLNAADLLPSTFFSSKNEKSCSGTCVSKTGKLSPDLKQFIDPYTGGYLVLPFKDIEIPSANKDLPFSFTRTYNSRSMGLGLFGYGWLSNFEIAIVNASDDYIQVVNAEGKILEFFKKSENLYETRVKDIMTLEVDKINKISILETKDKLKCYFNEEGRLTKYRDRNNNEILISYRDNRRIDSVIDWYGRKIKFFYEGDFVSEVQDPIGREYKYYYNKRYDLIRYVDCGGREFKFEYDNLHNLTNTIFPDGNNSEIQYSSSKKQEGYIKKVIAPDKSEQASEYKFIMRIDKTKGIQNLVGSFEIAPDEAKIVDSRGNTTLIEISDGGKLLEKTDPLGGKEIFKKDDGLYMTEEIDQNGNVTKFERDKIGNLTKLVGSAGYIWKLLGVLYPPNSYKSNSTQKALESNFSQNPLLPIGNILLFDYL